MGVEAEIQEMRSLEKKKRDIRKALESRATEILEKIYAERKRRGIVGSPRTGGHFEVFRPEHVRWIEFKPFTVVIRLATNGWGGAEWQESFLLLWMDASEEELAELIRERGEREAIAAARASVP